MSELRLNQCILYALHYVCLFVLFFLRSVCFQCVTLTACSGVSKTTRGLFLKIMHFTVLDDFLLNLKSIFYPGEDYFCTDLSRLVSGCMFLFSKWTDLSVFRF